MGAAAATGAGTGAGATGAASGTAAGRPTGIEPVRGRSPATATRCTGPRPYRHALAAGAVAGAPLAATRSTRFTVSTRAPG